MDDCIIISSDEEDQAEKKSSEPSAKKSTNKHETDSTKPIENSKEVKKEAEPSTSGISNKSKNGFTDPVQAFEEFVAICKRDHDPDMEKILNKMQKYYKNANSSYTESKEFLNFLSSKGNDVLRDPRNIYVFIKEVVDELRQRRSKRIEDDTGPPSKKQKTTDGESDPDEGYKAHKLKLLCKVMEKVKKKIQKLEEKEVNFDDDNDSAYIQLERYKERLVKIFEKICELSGEQKIGQIHRRKIAFTGTNSPEINKCIEKFINKTGQFPDYHDILSLVKTVESEKNKTSEQIRQTAIEAFVKAGEQLQLHRRYESWRALSAFLKDESDPADTNPDLQAHLKKNYQEYSNRIPEVIDQFAEKQTTEKLVAEEVPDEEADQSDGKEEDDEDDDDDDNEDEAAAAEGEGGGGGEEDEDDDNQEKDENETEFVEKVLSGEITDDDSDDDDEEDDEEDEEEEDRAKNVISLENLEHMDFNGRCGSVSPPTLGEDLNGRLKSYGEKPSEHSDAVVVIDIEKDPLSTDKSSCDVTEPIVIE